MQNRPTIKDIAKIANVSASAVSMALNDKPGLSNKTKQKILEIAKNLDYQPSFIAKSLIGGRSQTIAFVARSVADPFYAELALAIEEKASEMGYGVLIYNVGTDVKNNVQKEKAIISNLQARGVDGVILSTVTMDDPNIKPLIENRFPFVLVNRYTYEQSSHNKIDYVVLDNFRCGYMGIEHLYRLGHNRIAIIAGNLKVSTAYLRTQGSIQALKDLKLDKSQRFIVDCSFIREKAYKATKKLINNSNRPTAIFSQDDNMALGVRQAILEEKLHIPNDIALIGIDNIYLTSLKGIEITSISQNISIMGETGTETLINRIEGKSNHMVNQVIMEPEIIIRKSCGFYLKGYIRN